MKFKLDFDDLEELQSLLEEVGESMDEFEAAFSIIMDEIVGNSSGVAIEKLVEISEELLPTIKELTAGYEQQADICKQYLTGVEDINPCKSGIYELDTNEAKGYIDDTKNQIDKVDGMDKKSNKLNHFESSYKKQINEYHQVDGTINLEEDYPSDEDAKYYIRKKSTEIDQYIGNYYSNINQVEAVQDKLRSLNRSMLHYMDDLKEYKDIIEELKDFENTFNPGFWDKHGSQIKAVLTIAAFFVGTPIAEIIAGLEMAIAIGEGQGVAGAALGLIPGDKVVGAAGDVLKKADGKITKVGKSALSKADELTPGCFRCMMV